MNVEVEYYHLLLRNSIKPKRRNLNTTYMNERGSGIFHLLLRNSINPKPRNLNITYKNERGSGILSFIIKK